MFVARRHHLFLEVTGNVIPAYPHALCEAQVQHLENSATFGSLRTQTLEENTMPVERGRRASLKEVCRPSSFPIVYASLSKGQRNMDIGRNQCRSVWPVSLLQPLRSA